MKAVIRRSFRSVAMVAMALLVGLAAVPLFAGADVVDSTKGSDKAAQCPLSAKISKSASCATSGAADNFVAALLGDSDAGAKIAAALAKESKTCSTSATKVDTAGLSAKVNAVVAAEPSTCSAGKTAAVTAKAELATCSASAKVAKVTAEPSACSASKTDAVAKTEAVDAKIAKVVADAPACCKDEAVAVDAKVAKVVAESDACCQDEAVAAKVAEVVATNNVPECCQDKAAATQEAGD